MDIDLPTCIMHTHPPSRTIQQSAVSGSSPIPVSPSLATQAQSTDNSNSSF